MARTIQQIQTQINLQIQTDPILAPLLTTNSQTALWNLFSFVVATSICLFEQLQDIFRAQLEAEIASQPPGTPQWVVKQMLAFQYSSQTPQVVVFTNGVPGYPVVNTALQIIKNCAVTTSPSSPGRALVKVAQADTTTPLTQGVVSITITDAGSGYSTTPTAAFGFGGFGSSGATLIMPPPPYTVGQVINVTTPGSGYSQTPTVNIANGGYTTQATAVVNLDSQLAAAQSYMDVIGFTGINYELISLANDWLIVDATIQFNGQYTFTVVQTNVQNAITGYLTSLPFDGVITLTDLILAIKAVPGVIDLEFNTLTVTDSAGGHRQNMVVSHAVLLPQASTQSGTALYQIGPPSSIAYTTNPL